MTNSNDPAFVEYYGPINTENDQTRTFGLTKREYFAAMALQGICCSDLIVGQVSVATNANPELSCETLAQMAIMQTDALIKELSK